MGKNREEEQFNELFWNFCPHGIIAFDVDGKVANLNQSFQNRTGLGLPNLEGTPFEEFLHGFHDLESETILENLQKGHVLKEESVINYGKLSGHYPVDFYPVIEEDTFRGFFIMIHLDRPLTEKNEPLPQQELIEALNHTKESVLITDAQLEPPGPKIVYVNPGFSKMTGYRKSEVLGKTPRILQGPDTDRTVIERLKNALLKGEKFEGETFNYRKDGTPFILQWEITPLEDDNGKIKHYLAVQRDVTAKRKTEKQYQESEVQLTQYLAQAPFGIAIHNWEGIIYVNQKATQLVGYDDPQQLIGADIFQFLRPDYREEAKKRAEALLEEDQDMQPMEEVLLTKEGEEKEVQITGIPCFYQGQKAIQIIVVDISKQKAAERESQMQAERYRKTMEDAGEMMALHEPDATFTYVSPASFTETGYQADELIGHSPFTFIHQEDQEYLSDTLQKLSQGQGVNHVRFRIRNKTGDIQWLESNFVPILTNNGEVEQIQTITRNVTHQQEMQILLEEAQEMAGIGGWRYDPENDSVWLSPKIKAILEVDSQQTTSIEEIIQSHDSEYKAIARQCLVGLVKHGTSFDRPFKVLVNGKVKWVQAKGKAYYMDERIYRIGGSVQEITEEKEVQLARDRLFNNAMELMAIHRNWQVEHTNETWTRVLGWTQEELKTMAFADMVHPNYLNKTQRKIAEAEEQGITSRFENYLLCKNGDYKRLEGFGIKDEEKDVLYFFALDVTEEKAAKEKVQESEEKFRALSEGSTVGIYLFQNGAMQYANPQLAQITGYALNDLIGADLLRKIVHSGDRDRMLDSLYQHHNTTEKTTHHYEFRFYTAKGELRHGELYSTKIVYDGQPAILGSVLDITERKEAEQELLDNKHFIEKVNENSPALILIIDFDQQQFIYENGHLEAFTGYTIEQLNRWDPSAFIEEMFHPDDIAAYNDFIANDYALADGEINQTQVRIKTKAGPYKWMRITHTPFKRGEDGHVSQVISTKQDMDDWQHLMESYKRSEQYFRQLFENSAAGLILLDAEYNIQTCNPAFETIFQWTKKEMQGNDPKSFIVPEGREAESDKISQDTLKGQTVKIESIRVDKNGKAIPVLITSVPVVIDEVNVGIFHVYQDISEQKNNEAILQQQTEQLLKANEELERFAYITSHNLRAPVANLTALLDLFDPQTIHDDSMKLVFQKIEASIYQMDDTVNDLIDIVSRKNQSEQPKETVYFRDLLEKTKLAFAQSIKETGAEIEGDFRAAPSLAYVKITLQNIIHELIDNALKFRVHEKRPKISLRSDPIDNFICLKVTDNGLGFDAKTDSNRPFKFYQKLHPETSGKGKGLYLVKSLVESMGGQIHVDSEPYKGTTFYIYFKDTNRY